MQEKKGFTLIELLVVVAIIAILMAILLPSLGQAREYTRRVVCSSNTKQIAVGLEMYAKENNNRYPLATKTQLWEYTDLSGPKQMGWMRQLFPYIQQEIKIYKCPSFARAEDQFTYFLSCRAALAREKDMASVQQDLIEFPSAFVLGGDCNQKFNPQDCDRDDYNHECLGFGDMAITNPTNYWEPWHNNGLMVFFGDSHVKWYNKHVGREMTYSYNTYTDWTNALLVD